MGSHKKRRFQIFGRWNNSADAAPQQNGGAFTVRPSTRAEMGWALDVTGQIPVTPKAARVVTDFACRDDGGPADYDQRHYTEQPPTGDRFYGRPDDPYAGSTQESAQGAESAPPAGPRHYGDTAAAEPHSASPYADFVSPDDTQVIRPMPHGGFPNPGDGFMSQR